MQFDNSFFEDEVRLGFYIPGEMKRAWAAELEVLSQVDLLCQKHGIKYYADWGTLLATVRHRGFIPWDDDLDIVMLRNDYIRFREVSNELPEGYAVYNYKERDDYWQYLTRVVGYERMCFESEHLERFHQFPFIAGVDIFVLDNVSNDDDEEEKRDNLAHYLIVTADKIAEGTIEDKEAVGNLTTLDKVLGTTFVLSYKSSIRPYTQLRREMYEEAEILFGKYKDERTKKITQLFPFGMQDKYFRFDSVDYDKCVRLEYENITMPVPINYDSVLRRRYGKYGRLVKDGGAHGYPFYEAQFETLKEVMDFELPEFKCTKEDMIRTMREDSPKEKMTKLIRQLSDSLKDGVDAGWLQEVAISIGTLAEEIRPRAVGKLKCVKLLEEFCEFLYNCCLTNSLDDNLETSRSIVLNIIASLKTEILEYKNVVFICFKPDAWKYYDEAYKNALHQPYTDVYVVPVPYYYKAYDGRLIGENFIKEGYPEDIILCDYASLNLEEIHPDVIYIQNPYDEWNPVMTLPQDYYTINLKNNCEKLVYIPWFRTNDFDESDERQFHNMDKYVLMPGVVYADEIWLWSEMIRKTYIKKLCGWLGDSSREIFENKILVKNENNQAVIFEEGKRCSKRLLYHIELCSFTQFDAIMDKIDKYIDIMIKADIDIVWYQDKEFEKCLKKLMPEQYEKYVDRRKAAMRGNIIVTDKLEKIETSYDAYYGDVCYIPILMQYCGKPVLIANYDICQ